MTTNDRLTADKRQNFILPKLPSATSFIRKTLARGKPHLKTRFLLIIFRNGFALRSAIAANFPLKQRVISLLPKFAIFEGA